MIQEAWGKDAVDLSLLENISVNDAEDQCFKIASWLKQRNYVNGVGFFFHNTVPNRTYIYKDTVPKDILKGLEKIISRNYQEKGTESEMLFIGGKKGQVAAFRSQEQQNSLEPIGITIPLMIQDRYIGTLFLGLEAAIIQDLKFGTHGLLSYIPSISSLIDNSICHEQKDKKIRMLNLYQTVSSSLAYIGDLFELLTTIVSIVTTELNCEEGSVLLHYEDTNEFEFFTAIGETGMDLVKERFPADKGIAGRALRERTTLVVNDVQNSPDFYSSIDKLHDFTTKSMIAAPIISGEEAVGVINAINKNEGKYFDKEDDQILSAIADEVALAVKSAKLFEYVVDSYCKIRQGQKSCKGCKRPLKTWTPCVKHLNL